MKIAVVGSGYVGLVTGTCFAETGNQVTCIDIDEDKVEKMKDSRVPIYEPGLESLFKRNINAGRLEFTTSLEDGIKDAQVIFLALPTPPGEDGSADLSYILGVADKLGPLLKSYAVIVDKSTVPVGTADKVTNAIFKSGGDQSLFDVISNPEFLREGVAIDDFMKPDRVVIGTDSDKAKYIINELYEPFVRSGNPLIFMDIKSAELTKYAANAFLATKISFMDEIANLAEKIGADVDSVRKGIGTDSRIGKRFLFAGTGWGGSCFPKDVLALSKTGKENGYDMKIIESVIEVNERQKTIMLPKMEAQLGDLADKDIGIWGLAFKPNTDDVREAPALYMIQELLNRGANVHIFDPEAMETARAALSNITKYHEGQVYFATSMYDAIEDVDALLIMTEWSVFRSPDFKLMKDTMKGNLIFDGRNIYDPFKMWKHKFEYHSIGR